MYDELVSLRDSLKNINGVESCKIGIEKGISPGDYPLIRLVPVRATLGKPYKHRTVELDIYFGWDTGESNGLELVYKKLDALEKDILIKLKAADATYTQTVTDEDRLDTYKLMRISCTINAERPAP